MTEEGFCVLSAWHSLWHIWGAPLMFVELKILIIQHEHISKVYRNPPPKTRNVALLRMPLVTDRTLQEHSRWHSAYSWQNKHFFPLLAWVPLLNLLFKMAIRQICAALFNAGKSPLSLHLCKCADLIVYHSTAAEPPACTSHTWREVRFNISAVVVGF